MVSTCNIVIVKHRANELGIELLHGQLNKATETSIYNAWMETAIIDNHGTVWLLPDRLAEILRTSKPNASYIRDRIRDEYKRQSAEGIYLSYSEVSRILSDIIQSAGSIKREQYAEFSESIGMAIRKSAKAKLIRAETAEAIKTEKRKLKTKRIKLFSISRDELTRLPLLPSSEFAHIRSCSIYPRLATNCGNGLIVNKNIHQIVTQKEINDEHQLFRLCEERNWETRWYSSYLAGIAEFN